jgi:hypothetical protein|tara:strand:+ start:1714 stop:2061 length:348 start_codon:yes stop_codon:yes gene_type:complete
MKNLITALIVLFAFVSSAQDFTLLHINAKWNQSNDYDLRGIRHAKVQMAFLEDQSAQLKSQIKSVPTIILFDQNSKPRGQWQADLSFKITVPKEEIQQRINFLKFGETTRRKSTE